MNDLNSNQDERHREIIRKAKIVIPAYFELLKLGSVKESLKSIDGRMELREDVRNFVELLKQIEVNI